MSNPPRQKGTRYENRVREWLRSIFGPDVERAPLKGVNDAGDFIGLPLVVEAKNTERPAIPEWCRVTRDKTETWRREADHWLVIWSGGDARKASHPGELVVMPKAFADELLRAWQWAADSGQPISRYV